MEEAHPIPSVGAVMIDDGRILLIQRGRGAYAGMWAVPGGRQRRGETMQEAGSSKQAMTPPTPDGSVWMR